MPGVSYESQGRVLILGAEHRVRLAGARLAPSSQVCGLITEAMPEAIDAEMEAAAEQPCDFPVLTARLLELPGYLGRFDARIDVDGEAKSLAALAFKAEFCDVVLDLGTAPSIDRELNPPGYFRASSGDELEGALAAIGELKGSFEKPRYFQVNIETCAHGASGMTGCTRCLDACPADAIRSIDLRIQVDAHLCHGAGACSTACPTGAIRYDHPAPQDVLETVQEVLYRYRRASGRTPRILLHDAAAGADWVAEHLEALPGCWLPVQVEEVGSAGPDIWLQALAQGAVEVVLLIVGDVPASVRAKLDDELSIANRVLAAIDCGRTVRCVDPEALLQHAPGPAPADIPELRDVPVGGDKRPLISSALSHLYEHSPHAPTEVISLPVGSAFGNVAIDATGCTLCSSCVAICPTFALRSGRDEPRLTFTEDHCVQCGLCVQACPEKVLALEPRYVLDPSLRTEARLLKEEEPFKCIRCGEAFSTHSMIATMKQKLAGHSMFAGDALKRLEMCGDCRVADQVLNEPDSDLAGMARPRAARQAQPVGGAGGEDLQ